MKEKLPQISEAEFEVMQVIWDNAPINTNEIVSLLKDTSGWSPKTIQTMLIRLEKKGAITHEKDGRVYVYSPIIPKEDYISHESRAFLNKFFNGALDQMVVSYLSQNDLSPEDIASLRSILDQKAKD
ncbi:BlaI/MecI/CopY family transcriptional regulator [Eubacterium sp. 1001713B170207_170306_E7]|uniref:BlaI/MecI/CopY family transcriptional regulator n=1 Tax=Eubacterium sp. 1001713B170207_170306_E7 TaxID=2787097 RepID=UPI001898887B|nr:BlaI/MecI/CopY family transcriptional regulator [Eubacterium sp. 1001713B170207_170306_E7]